MADLKRIERSWILLRMLSAGPRGVTIKEMAAGTGVNQRTVRRDLALLQRIGFPLEESRSEHGRKYWRLSDNDCQSPFSFSRDESGTFYFRLEHPGNSDSD